MSADPAVIEALEASLAADDSNVAVRNHLAGLLLMSGDAERALEHAQQVLDRIPDDVEALTTARDSARALGDGAKADSYARLLGIEASPPAPVRQPAQETGTEPDDDLTAEIDSDLEELLSAERPRVTLADVGGLDDVKAKLDSAFLAPLRNPELRAFYGASLRGGLMLYGPPGCGKTYLARAVAGELGAAFFSLGISEVLDMWLGSSEQKLHDAFAAARRAAPCVLFLDEIDALGHKRSHLKGSAGRNIVNQLLVELDGVNADNEGLFVLSATNHPWDVDTALRRPGRLDRTVLVLPPDQAAREAILAGAFKDRPTAEIDIPQLAARTDGLSGADLAALVETASEEALQESIASGSMTPISAKQVERARKQTQPSTRAWFGVAHNYAIYANEGGEYDDLLTYIRTHKLL